MKKLITGFTVLSALAMSIVPTSVSAIYIPSASSETIQKQLDGYTYLTEFDVSENDHNYPSDYSLYIQLPEETESSSAEKFYGIKLLMKEDYDALSITIPDGNGRKVLSDAMQEAGINGQVFTDDDIKCECRIYNYVSVGDVKALYSKLKESELITEFVYSTELYSIREGGTSNELLGKFGFCSYDYDTGKWTSPEKQLSKYNKLVELAETLFPGSAIELDSFTDKELGFTAYNASVVPADDMSIEDQIDFALKVKEETGIFGGYYINETTAPALKTDSIDFINSVIGDSNCDGTVELADAILIMQSLANPDKYRISSQGKFNSDTGNDGISPGDALAIQEMLLGVQ